MGRIKSGLRLIWSSVIGYWHPSSHSWPSQPGHLFMGFLDARVSITWGPTRRTDRPARSMASGFLSRHQCLNRPLAGSACIGGGLAVASLLYPTICRLSKFPACRRGMIRSRSCSIPIRHRANPASCNSDGSRRHGRQVRTPHRRIPDHLPAPLTRIRRAPQPRSCP
jgi:hypothetical protein